MPAGGRPPIGGPAPTFAAAPAGAPNPLPSPQGQQPWPTVPVGGPWAVPAPTPRRKKGPLIASLAAVLVVVLVVAGGLVWFLRSKNSTNAWVGTMSADWAKGTRELWSVDADDAWISPDGRWMITVEDSGSDYSYTAYALKGEELGDPVLLDGTRNASTMTDPMFMAGDKAMVAGRICELANGKCQDAPWDANDLTAYQETPSGTILAYDADCTPDGTTITCPFTLLTAEGQEIASLGKSYTRVTARGLWDLAPDDYLVGVSNDSVDILNADTGQVVAHLDADASYVLTTLDGIVVNNEDTLVAYTWDGTKLWQEKHDGVGFDHVWTVKSVNDFHDFVKADMPQLSSGDLYNAADKDSRFVLKDDGKVINLVTGETRSVSTRSLIIPLAEGAGFAVVSGTSTKQEVSFWASGRGSSSSTLEGFVWYHSSQRLLLKNDSSTSSEKPRFTAYAPK